MQDDPASPTASTDLLEASPKCLFSESPFSRLRQFLRCLRLKPDFEPPDEGDGVASPNNIRMSFQKYYAITYNEVYIFYVSPDIVMMLI